MKKILLTPLLLFLWSLLVQAQVVSILNNKFVVNVNGNASCSIYFNGDNTPWISWNDFGGSYNSSSWTAKLVALKNSGCNATRIWFSCDGAGQPSIASDGTVSAPTQAFWNNCDDLFKNAQANGIYIYATMMSFDHTKKANTNSTNWQNMMNSAVKTQSFVDNYLVPFVNRYKSNPYLWAIDLCNEIEWIAENTASTPNIKVADINWGCSYAVLQRYVAICAAGLHQAGVARSDGSKVLVTLGSACVKWNGTKLPSGGNNPDGNKWSDANLKAQNGNDANSYLDFYSPHYYGWMEQYYSSPFEKTPAQYGMDDKPCIVAEMPSKDPMPSPDGGTNGISLTTAFNNLKSGGWQGHLPWTDGSSTAEIGSISDFGPAAQTFTNNNSLLVKPTSTPTVTSPVTYCQGIVAKPLTATGTSLLWYTTSSNGTGSSTAPTPSTSTAVTTNYYVSQTVNNCEGPRALIAVTVNAKPSVTITAPTNNSTVSTNAVNITTTTTGTGISKVEFFNAKAKLGEDASSPYSYNWTNVANGTYTLTARVTNSNNCTDSSKVTVTVSLTTDLKDNAQEMNLFQAYPNPFHDQLSLESKTDFDYSVFDLTGNAVEKGGSSNGSVTVGGSLPSGLYIVKVNSAQGNRFFKVTKR
jgi:hypothetical protein